MVRYTWFAEQFRGTEPETIEEAKWNTVGLYLPSALVTLPRVRFYDWGRAGLTTLYGYMSSTSHWWGRSNLRLLASLGGTYLSSLSITWQPWALIPGGAGPVCWCLGCLLLSHST
ncbi:hypothetical protein CsSME_00029172 [Camellia sinensis var. sinensis]